MELTVMRRQPQQFDSDGINVQQFWTTSADGERIPYFHVGKNAAPDTPTLVYAYGGFGIPELPHYLGSVGKYWLEEGNAFVLANIRGGGEFGPRWHQAAQGVGLVQESRQGRVHGAEAGEGETDGGPRRVHQLDRRGERPDQVGAGRQGEGEAGSRGGGEAVPQPHLVDRLAAGSQFQAHGRVLLGGDVVPADQPGCELDLETASHLFVSRQ